MAIVILSGAVNNVSLNDSSSFNGLHILNPTQQIIAIGNFTGSKITALNLSPIDASIIIMLLCPS